ncbi:Uncharacterised protein [Vibrio cholerae]|nr:Uncharacterised protein [Vibrio cholerae]CSI57874.1 Uncharacterised protein [Vibrio cholerae]
MLPFLSKLSKADLPLIAKKLFICEHPLPP